MSYEFILLEKEPPIGYIYLNTPENLNAVNVENLTELYSALEDCEQDESIRVIVLGAKGRMFSSGGNVKEFLSAIKENTASQKIADISEILHKCVQKIIQLPKPVVGKIHGGGAYGAGLNLVLSCDLVFADANASLDEAFKNVGLSIDGGGTCTIPRLIGVRKAKEFFWLGKIDAKEAEEWGLINKAVPGDELDQTIEQVAQKLAEVPPLNVLNTKNLLCTTFQNTIEQQLAEERRTQIEVAASEDFAEGVTAFFEKRKPDYKGK
jgi:2-(1,2-epoxy-1,2-dihydrophenyl)acetyl-CoA isomerase